MEEIQYLDEELKGLVKELEEKFEDLKQKDKSKKLNAQGRNDKIAYILDRISRSKDVLQNFRVELREVLREEGRDAHREYEAKGKEYNATVNKISTDLETFKLAAEKKELLKGGKKKKQEEPQGTHSNELIETGKKVQAQSAAALDRTSKLVDQMGEIGAETNIQLKGHTEKMRKTNEDVQGVQSSMQRASKISRDIARRLASDKLIMCLVLVLILLIIGVIVAKVLGLDLLGAVQCALALNISNSTCQNITAKIISTVTPPSLKPRKPRVNVTTTTPRFIETTATFMVTTTPPPQDGNSTDDDGSNTTVLSYEEEDEQANVPQVLSAYEGEDSDVAAPELRDASPGEAGTEQTSSVGAGTRRMLLWQLLEEERIMGEWMRDEQRQAGRTIEQRNRQAASSTRTRL